MLIGERSDNASKIQDPSKDQLQATINLYNQGRRQQTLEQVQTLFQQFPKSPILFKIQGITLQGMGQVDRSATAFKHAIALRPDYAEAYNNMGNALNNQGKLEEAVEAFSNAISLKPGYSEAYSNLGIALRLMNFKRPNSGLQKIIESMLEQKAFVRPVNISRAAISLLKFEPKLQKHLQFVDNKVTQGALDIISDLNDLPLSTQLMNVCPLPDLGLEKLFINLRSGVL